MSTPAVTSWRDELLQLMHAVCECAATPVECARLEQIVLASDVACQEYLRYMALHGCLNLRVAEALPAADEFLSPQPGLGVTEFEAATLAPRPARRLLTRSLVWSTVAAGLMFALYFCLISWGMLGRQPHANQVATQPVPFAPVPTDDGDQSRAVASILSDADVDWGLVDDGQSDAVAETGSRLTAGQALQIENGLLELQMDRGAAVYVQGPAQWSIDGDNAITLTRGKLLATVPPQAHGFTVNTPNLRVVDLGTEFGVEVNPAGAAVHVFRGSVETHGRGTQAGQVSQVVKAGQSIVVSADGGQSAPTPAARDKFAKALAASAKRTGGADIPEATISLLGLYPFDGDARDAGAGSRHATKLENIEFVPGHQGQAAFFGDAGNSIIELPIDASADTHPELTLGAWVKLPEAPKRRMEILSSDDTQFDRVLTLDERRGTAPAGEPQFAALAGPKVGVLQLNGPPPMVDRWTFVAVTYRQPLGLVMLYVEDPSLAKGQGGLRTELAGNAAIGPSHRTLRVGGHHNGSEMFHGAIDNVFVFAGALGHKQLEAIRTGGVAAILEYQKN